MLPGERVAVCDGPPGAGAWHPPPPGGSPPPSALAPPFLCRLLITKYDNYRSDIGRFGGKKVSISAITAKISQVLCFLFLKGDYAPHPPSPPHLTCPPACLGGLVTSFHLWLCLRFIVGAASIGMVTVRYTIQVRFLTLVTCHLAT